MAKNILQSTLVFLQKSEAPTPGAVLGLTILTYWFIMWPIQYWIINRKPVYKKRLICIALCFICLKLGTVFFQLTEDT